MKTRVRFALGAKDAYALLMVMVILAATLLTLAATLNRTYTEAKLNDRNAQVFVSQMAAEAAVEKTVARIRVDFLNYGLGKVTNNYSYYGTNIPNTNESSYWGNFQFTDGTTA